MPGRQYMLATVALVLGFVEIGLADATSRLRLVPFPKELVLGQGTFPLQGKLVRANRDAHEALGRDFSRLWLAESKPYALEWTIRRDANVVKRYDDLARRPADARRSAAAGEPLPQPDELGLALSVAPPSGT